MKSIFWFICVVLVAATSCSPQKKAEILPVSDSSSRLAVETSKTGNPDLVRAISGTYMFKTIGSTAIHTTSSNISDVTLKLYECGKFLIQYASGDSDNKFRIGATADGGWSVDANSPQGGLPSHRGAWDATEKSRVQGTWHIEGTPEKGSIRLTTRNGNTQIYVYEVKQKGWLNFNGDDFWRMGSALCK